MADNQEVPMWVKLFIGVVLFAVTIGTTVGGVAWAMSKDSTSQSYVVESLLKTDVRHDQLIASNTQSIAFVADEVNDLDKERIKLEGKIDVFIKGQEATVKEMTELKNDFKSFADYLRKFDYDKKKEIN